jgi:DNA-directed RNA polymerase specialized sigma24 family protein
MRSAGSVTCWIQELKAGEEQALEQLRQRYWPFLVGLAAKKLRGAGVRATDGEDVAQEAFWGFYRSFKAGRLPRLANRKDVLAVLTIIAVRKAAKAIRVDAPLLLKSASDPRLRQCSPNSQQDTRSEPVQIPNWLGDCDAAHQVERDRR